jgi:hypothetical protein
MSLAGFAFQACSFNHSDISPLLNQSLPVAPYVGNRKLCKTYECSKRTYALFKYSHRSGAEGPRRRSGRERYCD